MGGFMGKKPLAARRTQVHAAIQDDVLPNGKRRGTE
jgi:hypothetical protein